MTARCVTFSFMDGDKPSVTVVLAHITAIGPVRYVSEKHPSFTIYVTGIISQEVLFSNADTAELQRFALVEALNAYYRALLLPVPVPSVQL